MTLWPPKVTLWPPKVKPCCVKVISNFQINVWGLKIDPQTPNNNLALDKNDFSTLCRSFDAKTITLSIEKEKTETLIH